MPTVYSLSRHHRARLCDLRTARRDAPSGDARARQVPCLDRLWNALAPQPHLRCWCCSRCIWAPLALLR